MGSYWLPMFLWFVKHSPGPDHILHWFLWLMLHQKNGSILPVKIEQFLMTHLISYKMNHIYIVYICIWLLLWCIYIFTIIVIAHVLLGSKNVCFAFCGSQATSMALRCWKCPQLGPSCTPSPFETRDQRPARWEDRRSSFVKNPPSSNGWVWWFSKNCDFMGFHRPSWFSSLGDSYGLWQIYRTS